MAKPTKRQRELREAADRFDAWFGTGTEGSRSCRRGARRIDARKRAQFHHTRGTWRDAVRASQDGSSLAPPE